jgi:hypothetical protein
MRSKKPKKLSYIIYIILIIIIIILSSLLIFIIINRSNNKNNKNDKNDNNIIKHENYQYEPDFLNKERSCKILQKDLDNFYSTFSELDLYVRKVNSVEQYVKDVIPKSVEDFTDELKDRIKKCIFKMNENFPKFRNKYSYLDIDKFLNIPWKIGLFNKLYECGLPHTRNEYIFLPKEKSINKSDLELLGTLVHEKIHVYQKLYPEDIQSFLNENNFKKYKPYIEFKKTENKRANANPDIDQWTYYQDDDLNKVFTCKYNENPKSITDKICYPKDESEYEHPLEMMAIKLSYDMVLEN